MPEVSVIIPAYNRKSFLENAVKSVLAQTFSDFEIIVVDDASTDDTLELLTQLVRGDSRVRFEQHQTNLGAQAARNTGIRASRCKWIAFLDSDDFWLPESLSWRLELATKTGAEVVHSACYTLEDEGGELKRFVLPPLEGSVYKDLLAAPGPTFPSLLVSKQALIKIGYLDSAIPSYQEWDTAIRLARHYSFAYFPQPTFVYDCRHRTTISQDSVRAAAGYERVFKKHKWAILRHLGPKALAFHYRRAAGFYYEANNRKRARTCIRKACLLWPLNLKIAVDRVRNGEVRP